MIRFMIAGLVAFLVSGPSYAQSHSKKNVLFLIADDLNCDLHCYGHRSVRSPNIDKLASRGVRFERAYCQFPLCSPSRTSFMTGRRPNSTGIVSNPKSGTRQSDYVATPHFREHIPDTVTMSQLFRNNGYRSIRIGKIYHYGVPGQIGTNGLDDLESWDYVVNPAGRDKAEENQVFSMTPGSYGGSLSWHAAEGADEEQTDGLIANSAISLLREHQDRPFFMAVGFFRPHTPYVAPKGYFAQYPWETISLPKLSPQDLERKPAPAFASSKKEQEGMSDELRRKAIQAYWSSISFMDHQLGRVVDELHRLGLEKNTVIVMTSDHGYHMYEHGLWQKQSLFENSARVPLILIDPEQAMNTKSEVSQSIVELVDLYPTLADLCGLAVPGYLEGKSLKPILKDPTHRVKEYAFTQVRRGNKSGYSVRSSQWRMTIWNEGRDGEQLYDMERDPTESTNLIEASTPEIKEVSKVLREQLIQYAGGK